MKIIWVYVCTAGRIFVVFVSKLNMGDKIHIHGRAKNIVTRQ